MHSLGFTSIFSIVNLDFETAVCAELFVKDKPIASMAHAIVFAVYMPHRPGPGIAFSI